MDLEAIDRLGLTLYRDPEAHVPMCDALEDLGLRWSDWLERGSLERLAEYMCELEPPLRWSDWLERDSLPGLAHLMASLSFEQTQGYGCDKRLNQWFSQLGCEWEPGIYVRLCGCLRVPAVQIEIAIPDGRFESQRLVSTSWSPPSVELAKATLREAMTWEPPWEHRQIEDDGPWMTIGRYADQRVVPLGRIARAVRQSHPQATNWRIRVGHDLWQEQLL
jgi:hypothetical protein